MVQLEWLCRALRGENRSTKSNNRGTRVRRNPKLIYISMICEFTQPTCFVLRTIGNVEGCCADRNFWRRLDHVNSDLVVRIINFPVFLSSFCKISCDIFNAAIATLGPIRDQLMRQDKQGRQTVKLSGIGMSGISLICSFSLFFTLADIGTFLV